MSKQPTTELTLKINDLGTSHHIVKQHGMRYPDGTIRWDKDKLSNSDYDMWFEHIANDTNNSRAHWEQRLRNRAQAVKLDPEQYALQHTALTRDVIIVITEAEEV